MKILLWPALACLSFLAVSCEDKVDDSATPNGIAELHVHQVVKNKLVESGGTYTLSSGRKMQIDISAFYLSNITLKSMEGKEYSFPAALFIDNTEKENVLGNLPPGTYTSMTLHFGLDSATNHSDITQYPDGHPLALQEENMHWSWSTGYIFMKIEGSVDTTASMQGPISSEFAYHLTTDEFYKDIKFDGLSLIVKPGQTKEIVLQMDYDQLFKDINPAKERQTHTTNNKDLALRMWNNLENAVKIE